MQILFSIIALRAVRAPATRRGLTENASFQLTGRIVAFQLPLLLLLLLPQPDSDLIDSQAAWKYILLSRIQHHRLPHCDTAPRTTMQRL